MGGQIILLYADIISKIMISIGIVTGGVWAYRMYLLRRESTWNLQMVISPEVILYNENLRLLLINLGLKNMGKVKIMPGSKGCRISVRKLPKDAKAGEILTWEEGGEIIIDEIDILSRYWRQSTERRMAIYGGYWNYEIEPNCEYHECVPLVVSKRELLIIKAEFWWKRNLDSIPEYRVILVE